MNWQHIEKIQNLPKKVHILGNLCHLKYAFQPLHFSITFCVNASSLNICLPNAWLHLPQQQLLLNFEEAFSQWRETQMREFIGARSDFWLTQMQTHVSSWQFKKLKATWGLCRLPSRVICLNTRLYHFSPLCIEAVLVHELSHLFHANHSPRFYKHLLHYFPEYKKAKLMLREPLLMVG